MTPPSPLAPPSPPLQCQDESVGWADEKGLGCSYWEGLDCTEKPLLFGYSLAQVEVILITCPICCQVSPPPMHARSQDLWGVGPFS